MKISNSPCCRDAERISDTTGHVAWEGFIRDEAKSEDLPLSEVSNIHRGLNYLANTHSFIAMCFLCLCSVQAFFILQEVLYVKQSKNRQSYRDGFKHYNVRFSAERGNGFCR